MKPNKNNVPFLFTDSWIQWSVTGNIDGGTSAQTEVFFFSLEYTKHIIKVNMPFQSWKRLHLFRRDDFEVDRR